MTDDNKNEYPGVYYWAVYKCGACGHRHRWANEEEKSSYRCNKCSAGDMCYQGQEQEPPMTDPT